jgi:hypothetical protein
MDEFKIEDEQTQLDRDGFYPIAPDLSIEPNPNHAHYSSCILGVLGV